MNKCVIQKFHVILHHNKFKYKQIKSIKDFEKVFLKRKINSKKVFFKIWT
jgi:hypothetical protein